MFRKVYVTYIILKNLHGSKKMHWLLGAISAPNVSVISETYSVRSRHHFFSNTAVKIRDSSNR